MELTGEYVGCDGEPRRLQVSCEASGDADPLQSLAAGVARMKELVAEFFGPLVERGAQGGTADPEDAVDGDDEDDTEDDKHIGSRTSSDGPSAKRPKPAS
ncbi:EKC/KEOPS complex subunit GON7 isoform X1 [Phodopus roborovskii]|uniref:Gon7 protein n=1 Tax=Phodopus roborovskii TaxID=109678 RepID=A0AAU9ZRJ0_PHORO|nr:EKC/KEOPS complex subunit GON7 isoform X1 [Phodopus roborovskii]CAH6849720.1 Gon7 [Phodopus roborovskii]